MNYLKLSGPGLLFLICCATGFAQNSTTVKEPDYNKPALFANFPDKIPVTIDELKNLFSNDAAKGQEAAVSFADRKLPGFNGKLVSRASKYNNSIRSVVIRSTHFNGATLTLSSSTTTDGAARYTGRIISFQHGDLFVLQKENDQYFLIKKKFNEVISE
ncbi:MAG: hypothetical protein ABI675_21225 [Chitinophagaceae bacterium]